MMAKTVTLSSLRTQIRQRCDMENSSFVSDSELNSYINASYAELYDLLVSRFEDYFTTTTTATVTAGNSSFAVPSDFYKLRGVDRQIGSSDNYYALLKFNFSERNWRNRRLNRALFGQSNINYRLIGDTVELLPEDHAAGTYRLWYVPAFTTLSSDSDTLDGVNGWEEYIVVDACIKCLEKEESSTTSFERQKQKLEMRIEEMASNRDFDQPERVTDMQQNQFDLDFPYT
jgi:hypothetical protein